MNDSKTEFTIFGSVHALQKCNTKTIRVGVHDVQISELIKLLGVLLDQQLNFKQHIASKARNASLSLYNLKKLRRYLSKTNCLKLINALVFSHFDYCNSLLINLPKNTLRPFQRIQNFAAKMAIGKSKFSSATAALKELHILPIAVRCEFKILVMVYKSLHGLAPVYLAKSTIVGVYNQVIWSKHASCSFHKKKNICGQILQCSWTKVMEQLATHVKNSESYRLL